MSLKEWVPRIGNPFWELSAGAQQAMVERFVHGSRADAELHADRHSSLRGAAEGKG